MKWIGVLQRYSIRAGAMTAGLRVRGVSILAFLVLASICGCAGITISLPTVINPPEDPNLSASKIEYLRQYQDSLGHGGLFSIFETPFTSTWASQRFNSSGMRWEYIDPEVSLANRFVIYDPSNPTEMEEYVWMTANRVYARGDLTYQYHLYVIKGLSTPLGQEIVGTGGVTIAYDPVYASFIPVGTLDQWLYPKSKEFKAHNVVHELGHLRADLQEYCSPDSGNYHDVNSDSVCVMSGMCLGGGSNVYSWCPGSPCGSPVSNICYNFCDSCRMHIKSYITAKRVP
ncbi:MAG: hypothetical protein NT028_09020 [candidate division Zixibacteria bacterium]|nr:hypothetical protein [candidate division Zixibacteria bacterium]